MTAAGAEAVGDDVRTKVLSWVEKSGRALELRVHRRLRSERYATGISVPFRDPTEHKIREGDILALRPIYMSDDGGEILGDLILTIECKHSRSDHWVGFTTTPERRLPADLDAWSPRHSGLSEFFPVALGGLVPTGGICHDIADADFSKNPKPDSSREERKADPNGKATKSGAPDGRSTGRDACSQVLSWAQGLRLREVPHLVLPVVVTTHPLWVVTLDAENQVEAEEVGWFGCRRPVPGDTSAPVSGNTPDAPALRETLVHIVHEDSLTEFLTAVEEAHGQMTALLRSPQS